MSRVWDRTFSAPLALAGTAVLGILVVVAGCASDGAGSPSRDTDSSNGAATASPMGAAGGAAPMAGANASGGGGTDTSGGGTDTSGGGTDTSGGGGTDTSGGGTDTGGGGTDTSGGEDSAAAANVDCAALSLPDNLDDVVATFEDATGATNVVEGRGGGFYMFNDGTGTQTPAPGALPPAKKMGRCDSLYALCMSGSGFTDWGAGMGTDLGPTEGEMKTPYDASEYTGIAFWARVASGTTGAVKVGLKDANTAPEGGVCDEAESSGATACNDDWSKSLNVTSEWKPYTITFAELRQTGWGAAYDAFAHDAIYSIQFQIGPNLDFDFCIDDLQLVR